MYMSALPTDVSLHFMHIVSMESIKSIRSEGTIVTSFESFLVSTATKIEARSSARTTYALSIFSAFLLT